MSGIVGQEAELHRRREATSQDTTLHTYNFFKHFLAFHFGRYEEAVQYADRVRRFVHFIVGTITVPISVFYDSLARLALCPTATYTQRHKLLRRVRRNQKRMAK